ncbi:MAG TPA: carboxypeptidase-like regulatory domain-containing protein [Bacteroidales bacterium]|nr:carboxypeptidase-like regulatory domain-containing protein [Bacteroidales bacterium]
MLCSNGYIFKNIRAVALLLLAITPQFINGQKGILDSTFTFRAGTIKTGNALNLITRETGYYFTYDSRLINPENKTGMSFRNTRLEIILDTILKNDSLAYSVIDKYIIISRETKPVSQPVDTLAQREVTYITGLVIDNESHDPLPFATIGLKNKGKGTVSNSNGEFGLNITPDCINDTLHVSYLGFYGREIPVRQAFGNNFTIAMSREFIPITEIIIRNQIPQEIIYKTLSAISDNYGNTPANLTGFYREGIMKKNELQTYSEAILQIFKSSYSGSLLNDQIKVYKSRKIENARRTDTLAIRLKAGLSTSLELDGVKNLFDFIDRQNITKYSYRVVDIISFDDESAFEIEFVQKDEIDESLFKGTIYINTSDFAILRTEFEINPAYINKMKETFISSSSRGFSTWPVSVKYSVSYRKVNNRYFLSHVRGDLAFTSRQKRKLFNTQFNVFFELAITGMNLKNVTRFEREELAPIHSVFSKTITSYDPDFWQNQDFLKPEDNLLQALKNMKVRMQEFSEGNH